MDVLADLWKNRKTSQGSIDITIFFINVLVFLCHLCLMVFYVGVNHKFMIIVNTISLLIYSYYLFSAHIKVNEYLRVAFFEIWIHMIMAVLAFGWHPGFQNWTYGLVCAFFLPSFAPIKSKEKSKRPLYVGIVFVLTYYLLKLFIDFVPVPFMMELDVIPTIIMFSINSLVSFVSIVMFTFFYTRRANMREHDLSRRADFDELTSLYNRHSLHYICDNAKKYALANHKPFSVAIIDLDHFKEINDKYGHNAGDEVLKEFANVLRASSVKGILSGRWGGEEFVMVAPYTIDYFEFVTILEKLRVKVSQKKFAIDDKKKINITVSIGAHTIDKPMSTEEAVDLADKNLYEAKETGRNKLVS